YCEAIMFHYLRHMRPLYVKSIGGARLVSSAAVCSCMASVSSLASLFSLPVCAQQTARSTPAVVQPGAPGKPTRTLPSTMRAKLPPASPEDVQFMQGMIMHHAQAVEM